MTDLVDQAGASYQVGEQLGRGGEGSVFTLPNHPGLVAKIFFPKSRTKHKHDKLRQMITRPPPGANQLVDGFPVMTWPQQILYDGKPSAGKFVGYTMQRIEMKRDFVPLYQVMSAARRNSLGGANLTWDSLVRLGLRIAHVVRTLHAMGYAVGDLNDRNILVSRRLTPLFLDTDSFQVPRGIFGHYPCKVGDRLYWPPELLGIDLATYKGDRIHSDRYALGVLLFQLFLNGMRPYQSRGVFVDDLDTLEKKTKAGAYAWANPKRGKIEPPAGAPKYDALPKQLRKAFEKAFVAGHESPRKRPSADDWYRTLKHLADQGFQVCRRNTAHRFLRNESRCPWCTDKHDPFRSAGPTRAPPAPGASVRRSSPTLAARASTVAVRHPWAPWR